MVPSLPQVKIQGCVGWNLQSMAPRPLALFGGCAFNILTGTINAFYSKSLKTMP